MNRRQFLGRRGLRWARRLLKQLHSGCSLGMGRAGKRSRVLLASYVALSAVALAAPGCKLPENYTETITTDRGEKISFDMVLIPGGKFLMGSPKGEAGSNDDERPQLEVRLKGFYLCTTETTIKLFMAYYEETVRPAGTDAAEEAKKQDVDAITGPTPVYGDATMGHGQKHPAIGMTCLNAVTFCRWLSKKTGRKYRLPTEAEWEHACRAGTTTAYSFGDDPNQLKDYAWFKGNSADTLHEVAKKKPNRWGLYDMPGNVREWVHDFYSPTAYKEAAKKTPAVNPTGPERGKVQVARGGAWSSAAEELRCAARAFEKEWWRSEDPQFPKSKYWLPLMDFIGFRVARSVEP